jgi:hypothetical protein
MNLSNFLFLTVLYQGTYFQLCDFGLSSHSWELKYLVVLTYTFRFPVKNPVWHYLFDKALLSNIKAIYAISVILEAILITCRSSTCKQDTIYMGGA